MFRATCRALLLAGILTSVLVCVELFQGPAEAGPGAVSYVFRRSWGGEGGQLGWVRGIVVGSDDTVYVADSSLNRITRILPAERTFSVFGGAGSGNGEFWGPSGMALDEFGDVCVADQYNHRIQKFDSSGNYLTQWGSYGSGNGQFRDPIGVAVDSRGNIYVTDWYNSAQRQL